MNPASSPRSHTVAPSRLKDLLATAAAAAVGAVVALLITGGSLVLVLPVALAVGAVALLTRRQTHRT